MIFQVFYDHWAVSLVGLFIVYQCLSWIHYRWMMSKLGAKPISLTLSDHVFGFYVWYPMLIEKRKGKLLEFNQEIWNTMSKNVSTFTVRVLGNKVISTKDPENVKALLATQFNDFSLGIRHAQFLPLLGDGIFTLDGEGWKQSRSMLRPQFAREQVGHVQALEPHIQILGKHINNHKGGKFDIQELFFRFTVDSATEFLFGESVGSLRDEAIGYTPDVNDETGKRDFAEAFNETNRFLATRALAQKFYWLIDNSTFREDCAKVHKFADYYVHKALNMTQDELEKSSRGGYIFLNELVKHTRNEKVLRDQLLNILLAGRDTTAGILSFIFFELARNPEIFEKLKQEIDTHFGRGDQSRVEAITFESLKKCEYLKAVVNEALRVYPVVPKNFRVAAKNTTLPRGGGPNGLDPILVTKGTTVLYSVYATHRDKEYYGEDSEVFRPERWFEPETKKLGWAYLPFNGGPRICLGQQFALTEASYVVTRLLQMYDNLQSFDEEYPPAKSAHLTMSLQNGCNISLT